MDFGVVLNSPTCKYHVDNFKNLSTKEWSVYNDHSYFLNFNHKHNVAILHWPYPYTKDFDNLVNEVYEKCDRIFITITEVHQVAVNFMRAFDREKITFYISGYLTEPLQHATVKEFHDWFNTTVHFYKNYLPEIMNRFSPYTTKEKSFEILLGRKKPHRDAVYNFARQRLNYYDYEMRYFNFTDALISEDAERWAFEHRGLKHNNNLEWTVNHVEYYGHIMSLSQVIPIEIYNRTAYSVVAETNWDNDYSFFTEKTAKPIIGKRLFIMFAGKGYLQALRNMGFKTFDSIIDESYDNESDNIVRYQMACQQMHWLTKQDQQTILDQVKPIAEHNFNLIMSRDWYNEFIVSLEAEIAQYLAQT